MTQIKICGIKRAETLACLTQLAVDYVGFVFAFSKRQVTGQQAEAVLRAVPGHPPAVGVFVNPSLAELEEVLDQAQLSVIQLHGRETPDFCHEVQERFSLPVWKAMAVGSDKGGDTEAEQIKAYRGVTNALLFDTYDPALAGGTGKRFSWEQIPFLQKCASPLPCIIAGGIHGENVGELIRNYRPSVIDVSSGVETEGEKDEQKIREFVGRVREA
ncbi:phosphoribosylanthranilate isomerase [Brevibacillus borstelensis]|uniref:phosphoribosylanthranilate isomerase n=1 Tax=Brevibacillus borstelensis TaxID=45462 RepID=UPI0030C567B5